METQIWDYQARSEIIFFGGVSGVIFICSATQINLIPNQKEASSKLPPEECLDLVPPCLFPPYSVEGLL